MYGKLWEQQNVPEILIFFLHRKSLTKDEIKWYSLTELSIVLTNRLLAGNTQLER